MNIQYIFVHHTAVSYKTNPDQWKATDAYHKGKGWGGGGYNYEISASGAIHQFRKDGAYTAAQYQQLDPNSKPTYNMNDGRALSICLDMNGDIEDPTPQQKNTLKQLLQQKMTQYNIPKENVFCHRRVATYKSCPGTRMPNDIYSYFVASDIAEPSWLSKAKTVIKKALPTHWF